MSEPDAVAEQPMPTKNDLPCIQDLLATDLRREADERPVYKAEYLAAAEDILLRKQIGIERYGTVLQPFNGRSALLDAYQELLDAAVYLRQAIEEHLRQPGNVHRQYPSELHRSYTEVLHTIGRLRFFMGNFA